MYSAVAPHPALARTLRARASGHGRGHGAHVPEGLSSPSSPTLNGKRRSASADGPSHVEVQGDRAAVENAPGWTRAERTGRRAEVRPHDEQRRRPPIWLVNLPRAPIARGPRQGSCPRPRAATIETVDARRPPQRPVVGCSSPSQVGTRRSTESALEATAAPQGAATDRRRRRGGRERGAALSSRRAGDASTETDTPSRAAGKPAAPRGRPRGREGR